MENNVEETKKIMIPWPNGEEREATAINLFYIEELDKRFLVYTFDEHDDNGMEVIHVSEAVKDEEENVVELKEINPEEWELVKEILREAIKSEEE